jgi:hypothetical protein
LVTALLASAPALLLERALGIDPDALAKALGFYPYALAYAVNGLTGALIFAGIRFKHLAFRVR